MLSCTGKKEGKPMACTCYGGNDMNCEVHHPRKEPPKPPLTRTQVEMVQGNYTKVDIEDYNRLLALFRGFRDQLLDEGEEYVGLMLIAVDGKGRIFTPMILESAEAKEALPDAMEM